MPPNSVLNTAGHNSGNEPESVDFLVLLFVIQKWSVFKLGDGREEVAAMQVSGARLLFVVRWSVRL